MTLTINGTDFVPFLAQQGLEQTWKTRESRNSGLVTADGTEHVAILSQKRQLKVSLMALTAAEAAAVSAALAPGVCTVRYEDLADSSGIASKRMVCRTLPAGYLSRDGDGVDWWRGVRFTLEEL